MTDLSIRDEQEHVIQLRIRLCHVSPAIWRRLLVKNQCTIAELHETLQILMGWTDEYLHHFEIRGKEYGLPRLGTWGFYDDATAVKLGDFRFREREKFFYRYNYYDGWELEIRVENFLPINETKHYPVCINGKRAGPPENCGGPWRFLELQDHYSIFLIAERLNEIINDKDLAENRWNYEEEVRTYLYWLTCHRFDRRAANQSLKQAATKREVTI